MFLLAVPVMLPLLVLGPVLIPESKDPAPGPVDPLSVLLALATMTPLVFAIKTLAATGLDALVATCLLVSVASGVAFVRRQLSRPSPMLDVTLFTRPVFTGAVLANLLSVFSLVGFLYFVSQHLQLVSGRSPMEAGLVLVPGLVVTIIAGLLAVRLVRRIAPATVITVALGLNSVAFALVALAGSSGSDLLLLSAFVLLGAGVGAAETLSNDLILSAVPAPKAGAASAISETAYETGAVLGTAVLGSLLNLAYRTHLQLPTGLTDAQNATASETLGGATAVAGELPEAVAAPLLDSARQAFDSGVLLTSGIGAVLMVIAAVIAHRAARGGLSGRSPQRLPISSTRAPQRPLACHRRADPDEGSARRTVCADTSVTAAQAHRPQLDVTRTSQNGHTAYRVRCLDGQNRHLRRGVGPRAAQNATCGSLRRSVPGSERYSWRYSRQ